MNSENSIRINKYLSQAGVLSRRKADEAIEQGLITINGITAVAGDKVDPEDVVLYKGQEVKPKTGKKVIIVYNKPLGLVCTSKEADKDSIFRKLDYPGMLYYVGRLDKNSQGLLLLTDDGELSDQIQRSRNNHEKEYVVRVDKPLTREFIEGMKAGVPLEERTTKPCKIYRVRQKDRSEHGNGRKKSQDGSNQGGFRGSGHDENSHIGLHDENSQRSSEGEYSRYTFRIIITEGINRQIRRMCEYFGYRVVFLKRVRVMNVKLGKLEVGKYRELTPAEEKELRSLI